MSKPNKQKIAVSEQQPGLNDLFSVALAGLAETLPPGPESHDVPLPAKKKGRVTLHRETAHRGGKSVIVIRDWSDAHSDEEIEAVGSQIRKGIGVGGTVKNREVVIQCNKPDGVRRLLEEMGYRVDGVR